MGRRFGPSALSGIVSERDSRDCPRSDGVTEKVSGFGTSLDSYSCCEKMAAAYRPMASVPLQGISS